MENSVSAAALNAAREQLDAAEAAREAILLQHIANGVIIDSRTVQIAPDVVIAPEENDEINAEQPDPAKDAQLRAAVELLTEKLEK